MSNKESVRVCTAARLSKKKKKYAPTHEDIGM